MDRKPKEDHRDSGSLSSSLSWRAVLFLLICYACSFSLVAGLKQGRQMVVISTTGSSALPPSLGQHAMVPNPDASNPGFFLFGGIDAAGNASSQLWQFSITSEGLLSVVGEWTKLADSPFGPRFGHSAYSFSSGGINNVVIFGGSASGTAFAPKSVLNDVHVWQRATSDLTGPGSWISLSPPSGSQPSGRVGHTTPVSPLSGALGAGVLFGGFDGTSSGIFNDLWILSVQNGSFTWQQLTSSLPGVYYHSACTVGTDMVIIGGVNNTGDSVGQVFTIQLGSSNQLVTKASYPGAGGIAGHQCETLSDNTILTVGGVKSFGGSPALVTDSYIFDYNASSWDLLSFESTLGAPSFSLLPGVVKLNSPGTDRVFVYGGFSNPSGTSPTNKLIAFDIYDVNNQTIGTTSQSNLIASSSTAVAFFNETLQLTVPSSTSPLLTLEFLGFTEEPFVNTSVDWPTASSFKINTFDNSKGQGFTATATLSNGAVLGLSGLLPSQPTTFQLSPNTSLTTNPGAFKFSLDISNWSYLNRTATQFLELQMLINVGGQGLQGGFFDTNTDGISQYLFCTATSCSKWQIPNQVFADGTYTTFTFSVAANPEGLLVSFLFPPFQNSLTFDPDFTLTVPQTTFRSTSTNPDEIILLLVAIFIPVFFVLIVIVLLLGCVAAKLQGSRFIADVPDDDEDEKDEDGDLEDEHEMRRKDADDEDDNEKL